jgi:S1-C subfamily serine protease
MDGFYAAVLNLKNDGREVDYSARKDDWFVVTGRAGNKRFYTRAQCRYSGVVTIIDNVPLEQAGALGFLFTAMANSLSLRPALNARGTPQPRIDYPAPSPRITTSTTRQPQASARPPLPDIDRTGKTSSLRLALGDGTELRAQDIFERVAGAVFVVQTDSKQGSAVAISDRELLTNCHVVVAQTGLYLEREGRRTVVSLVSADADADRCVLRSDTALPKWVRIRPYADTRVGERVFTVGAPEGLELSIAEGIVSSKRNMNGYRYLQTTAPISPGSSGGGLFDAQGNLLGITTFMRKDGQNLNFAIPAEEYAR